jgi:NADH:ubiquinone oxidoreductase subunit K
MANETTGKLFDIELLPQQVNGLLRNLGRLHVLPFLFGLVGRRAEPLIDFLLGAEICLTENLLLLISLIHLCCITERKSLQVFRCFTVMVAADDFIEFFQGRCSLKDRLRHKARLNIVRLNPRA